MAVTAKQVFDMACVLIDEVSESGAIVLDNPDYYEKRAQTILTVLQTELLPNSLTPVMITDLEQDLLLDDRAAMKVLPYGLAAHLLLTDDPNTASYFNNRYDELKRTRPAKAQTITDSYNVVGGLDG